jgi:hypothetical protein
MTIFLDLTKLSGMDLNTDGKWISFPVRTPVDTSGLFLKLLG